MENIKILRDTTKRSQILFRLLFLIGLMSIPFYTMAQQKWEVLTGDSKGYVFKLDNKWGFMDGNKNVILANTFEGAQNFSDDLAAVSKDGKWGYINKDVELIIPYRYKEAGPFMEGLARVIVGEKSGYINKLGNTVIPFIYDQRGGSPDPDGAGFVNGLTRVSRNNYYGMIDNTGKIIVQLKYDKCRSYSEGLIPVKLNGRWGAIAISGKTIIDLKYDQLMSFEKGLGIAWYELNGKWGLVNKEGREVIPPVFNYTNGFEGGYAKVQKENVGLYGIVDKSGKEVTPFIYDYFKADDKLQELISGKNSEPKNENTAQKNNTTSTASVNQPISPDVKSWSFVRNMVGSSFSDAKTAILDNGFKLESSAEVDGGTAYYFENSNVLYTYPSGRVTEDFYAVGVKKGKIVSVTLVFMVHKGKDQQSLLEKWEPFEKAFLRDNNYKKVDETNNLTKGQTAIVRKYSNINQHTKMRVEILKERSLFQWVEVILCNEDIDWGSED
jgi:hypothetical protein